MYKVNVVNMLEKKLHIYTTSRETAENLGDNSNILKMTMLGVSLWLIRAHWYIVLSDHVGNPECFLNGHTGRWSEKPALIEREEA